MLFVAISAAFSVIDILFIEDLTRVVISYEIYETSLRLAVLAAGTGLKLFETISIPYLLQAQPTLVLQLLACYCGSTKVCRRNGNCVDPNHTDS